MSHRPGRMVASLTALAVVFVTSACGIPATGSPTAIPRADVPFDLLNPSTPSPTILPVGVPESIYLVTPTQHLVAVSRNVPVPASLTEVLEALLEGPVAAERVFGLQSFLTLPEVQVKATVAGGIATVNFSASPVELSGPNQTLAIAQVVYTATSPGVTGVLFEIAGEPIDVPTASGAVVPGPVGRSAYLPQAPSS